MKLFPILILISSLSFARGIEIPKDFEVHGHRGARGEEPENSLYSFEAALKSGAHIMEADLVVTKDNIVVLNHDLYVNTDLCFTNDPKLKDTVKPVVRSITFKQLRTYDCGSKKDPEFPERSLRPGQKIVSFSEFLVFLKKNNSPLINIETKIKKENPTWSPSPKRFVELILAGLKKHSYAHEKVILQSFDFRTINFAKTAAPQIKRSALVYGEELNVQQVWKEAHKPEYLSPNAHMLSSSKIQEAHELGMKVVPWTLNKRLHWKHFIKMGVDGIITDYPTKLMKLISP